MNEMRNRTTWRGVLLVALLVGGFLAAGAMFHDGEGQKPVWDSHP